jgi:oxygen-independent coproporphyrinogen-3 oxidase
MMVNRNDPIGLYLHFPFCRSKCPYCDFYSLAAPKLIPEWLDGLSREAALYRADWPEPFATLFFGGGTPGLLSPDEFDRVMGVLEDNFSFAPGAEKTIELNPENVEPDKVRRLLRAGFDRFSMGVQSFDDEELRFLGRGHSANDAVRAIETLRSEGAANLGLDLMYGLPDQEDKAWIRSLDKALAFRPEHLSCYKLTVEGATRFAALAEKDLLTPPDEWRSRELFLLTSEYLRERGYVHYEISNFALGIENVCRHNQGYWRGRPYLGLGPAAHSFQGSRRWWNPRSIRRWASALADGRRPLEDFEILGPEEKRLEKILLGLRTRDGIDITEVQAEVRGVVERWRAEALAEVENGRLLLTPEGMAMADWLAVELVG